MPAPPRAIRRSDRLLIVGYTGCGKTELAKMIAARKTAPRLIVWDSKDELESKRVFPGVKPCRGLAALEDRLRRGGRIVHWVPLTGDREEYEAAADLVWRTPGPWLWWVDEAAECTTASWCPRGLRLAAQQGRATERAVMALTQRLAETHPVLRTQAEHIFLFAEPPVDIDLDKLAGHMGHSAAEISVMVNELNEEYGRHAHLWWIRPTREIRRCTPIPLRGAGRTSPRQPTATIGAPLPTATGDV